MERERRREGGRERERGFLRDEISRLRAENERSRKSSRCRLYRFENSPITDDPRLLRGNKNWIKSVQRNAREKRERNRLPIFYPSITISFPRLVSSGHVHVHRSFRLVTHRGHASVPLIADSSSKTTVARAERYALLRPRVVQIAERKHTDLLSVTQRGEQTSPPFYRDASIPSTLLQPLPPFSKSHDPIPRPVPVRYSRHDRARLGERRRRRRGGRR